MSTDHSNNDNSSNIQNKIRINPVGRFRAEKAMRAFSPETGISVNNLNRKRRISDSSNMQNKMFDTSEKLTVSSNTYKKR